MMTLICADSLTGFGMLVLCHASEILLLVNGSTAVICLQSITIFGLLMEILTQKIRIRWNTSFLLIDRYSFLIIFIYSLYINHNLSFNCIAIFTCNYYTFQDTVEIYLVFFLCYLILVPLQIHAVLRQRHIVPKLFTASVALELTAVTANVIHVLKFAVDGEGHPGLAVFGDVMDIIARVSVS